MSRNGALLFFAAFAAVLFLIFRKRDAAGWSESVPAYMDANGNVNYVPQTVEVQAGADPVQTIDAESPWSLPLL